MGISAFLLWSEPRLEGSCPGTQRKPLLTEGEEELLGPLAEAGTSKRRLYAIRFEISFSSSS